MILSTNQTSLSLAEARRIVGDLFRPKPWVYWTDFLLSFGIGMFLNVAVRRLPEWLDSFHPSVRILQTLAFFGSVILLFRVSIFIHEIAHLPQREFKAFRTVWNLLFGIPSLMPSFVYYTHLDHHRRKHFGTQHDGEYLPFERDGRLEVFKFIAASAIVPLLAVLRFAVITPLTWLHPAIRTWVLRHASSMVIDPSYIRPLPTRETQRVIFIQELACFAWCWGIAITLSFRPLDFSLFLLAQTYLTAVVILAINAVRTLATHRWRNDGRELTFVEQLLDSVVVTGSPIITEIWAPLGTRYHALHHLFPSLPYHSHREAHRRLMHALPAGSPYHQTVEPTLVASLQDLFRRIDAANRPREQAQIEPDRRQAYSN